MKKYEYIKRHASELYRLCEKRKKISNRYTSGECTHKQMQKLNAELNWLGMEINKTEERILFALGRLLPEDAQSEYNPSPFHKYEGIRKELEKLKFDN